MSQLGINKMILYISAITVRCNKWMQVGTFLSSVSIKSGHGFGDKFIGWFSIFIIFRMEITPETAAAWLDLKDQQNYKMIKKNKNWQNLKNVQKIENVQKTNKNDQKPNRKWPKIEKKFSAFGWLIV
jgi:hypothetical protein